jgi:hypothetical protein
MPPFDRGPERPLIDREAVGERPASQGIVTRGKVMLSPRTVADVWGEVETFALAPRTSIVAPKTSAIKGLPDA